MMVEKHLTLARADGGPDAGFSLEPHEFVQVASGCKAAWAALGDGSSKRPAAEAGSRQFRRSLYAAADIAPGEALTRANIRSIRPGHGLPPRDLPALLGRAAKTQITRGTPLSWELIA
jgi:N-acetylneuraminate synthase